MPSYNDFVSAGKDLGLAGSELKDFADSQYADFKKEEEKKRIVEEKKEEKKKIEEENKKKEEERREIDRFEREMRLLERKSKIEQSDSSPSSSGKLPHAPHFKFTPFNEKSDQLDTFFQHFEMQCSVFGVKEKERAAYLISLFSGQTREAFLKLAPTATYSEIKTALLQRFNLTTNDYRKKFFSSSPKKDENISSYSQRLSLMFDKWIELSSTSHDFDSLKDLILRHRVLDSCNPRLTCFLLEREPSSVKELEQLTLKYFSAHETECLGKSNDLPLIANAAGQLNRGRSIERFDSSRRSWSQGRRKYDGRFGNYTPQFGANDFVHKKHKSVYESKNDTSRKDDCSESHKPQYGDNDKKHVPVRTLRRSGVRCYMCSGVGHVQSECPSQYRASYVKLENKSQSNMFHLPDSLRIDCCNESLESDRDQHIYEGVLVKDSENKSIRVLRDTGSMIHAVQSDMVSDEDYTGEKLSLITFGGKVETFSLAKINVDTPFLSGCVVACVLENYPVKHRCYDVLVGNGSTLGSPRALDPTPQVVERWEVTHNLQCCEASEDVGSHFSAGCNPLIEGENVVSSKCIDVPCLAQEDNATVQELDNVINMPDNSVHNHIDEQTNFIATKFVPNHVYDKLDETLLSNQVTTRAQSKQFKVDKKPLNENVLNFEISHEELAQLQRQDTSLEKVFQVSYG